MKKWKYKVYMHFCSLILFRNGFRLERVRGRVQEAADSAKHVCEREGTELGEAGRGELVQRSKEVMERAGVAIACDRMASKGGGSMRRSWSSKRLGAVAAGGNAHV